MLKNRTTPFRARQCPKSYRRQSSRYFSGVPVKIGWWIDESFHEKDAVATDISQGGLGVRIDHPPPADIVQLQLRLSTGSEREWVQTIVRGRRSRWFGSTILHLQFKDGCPYDFFRTALPQMDLDRPAILDHAEEFDPLYWR